jgi:hypothetical protein
MRHWVKQTAWVVAWVWASGCELEDEAPPEEPPLLAAGEPCERAEDCALDVCRGGICVDAGSCGVGGDGCAAGFVCQDPHAFEVALSLGLARGSCRATCDVCPHQTDPFWSCADDDICTFDPAPQIRIEGPAHAIVGEPVSLSADVMAHPDQELVEVTWEVDAELVATGAQAEVTFDRPGTRRVIVTATDDGDHVGEAILEVAACSSEGGPCGADEECCAGTCDIYGGGCQPAV